MMELLVLICMVLGGTVLLCLIFVLFEAVIVLRLLRRWLSILLQRL